jgi:phosphoribosylformylglycinamidine cyclo-ligase
VPRIFGIIRERGKVNEREMFRTFNMGIGMVAVVRAEDASRTARLFARFGLKAYLIGELIKGKREVIIR